MRLLNKLIASSIIVFSLAGVLLANLPYRVEQMLNRITSPSVPLVGNPLGLLLHGTKAYARSTGLDARWQMFSQQERYNWWYFIKASYADGTVTVLPLARQSPRSFWQNALFDLKEAKLYQNLRDSRPGRWAYARYLCGQHSSLEGSPIRAIIYEFNSQDILSVDKSIAQGSHLVGNTARMVQDMFECVDPNQ